VGAASPNKGCCVGFPHTTVLAPLPTTIWGAGGDALSALIVLPVATERQRLSFHIVSLLFSIDSHVTTFIDSQILMVYTVFFSLREIRGL
jgi:hypothetical protein